MEVLQAIKERRSIRRFKNSLVESSKIELPQTSPYLGAERGEPAKRRFYFVYNDKIKEKLVLAALDQDFIKEAPLRGRGMRGHDHKTPLHGARGSSLRHSGRLRAASRT